MAKTIFLYSSVGIPTRIAVDRKIIKDSDRSGVVCIKTIYNIPLKRVCGILHAGFHLGFYFRFELSRKKPAEEKNIVSHFHLPFFGCGRTTVYLIKMFYLPAVKSEYDIPDR